MTEPVIIISGTAAVGESRDKKRERQGKGRHCGTAGHSTETDSVDISEEARERASGRKRKTILEYLED